jgi:hypothetical protein
MLNLLTIRNSHIQRELTHIYSANNADNSLFINVNVIYILESYIVGCLPAGMVNPKFGYNIMLIRLFLNDL